MNQQKIKLFRPMFPNKHAFHEFKRAYTKAPIQTRLKLIATARKTKGKIIHHVEKI